MLNTIDRFLNSITMYRLLLSGLALLALVSMASSVFGLLPYGVFSQVISIIALLVSCYVSNRVLEKWFHAHANVESWAITALILFFILPPATTVQEVSILAFGAVIAMASKFVFNIGKKHIFNPAACGAVVLGLMGLSGASWWVASTPLLPFTLILGLLVVHKIRRHEMFITFFVASVASILFFGVMNGAEWGQLSGQIFTSWPVIFFGTIMLTEPFTTPPTKKLQIGYGLLTGVLFGFPFRYGPLYATPELILLIGNLYSYAVSPKYRLLVPLIEKNKLAHALYEFVFEKPKNFTFRPGQYMEWTLEHQDPDGRGNRRYFTIASSPTEDTIRLAVKLPEQPSTFKKALMHMDPKDTISLSSLAGDFVLPKESSREIVCIAGGIGVTPFRSMVQYLVDKKEKRNVTVFYASSHEDEFAYLDVFEKARGVGVKLVRLLSGNADVPKKWDGKVGYLTAEMIREEVKDPLNSLYYLSGPNAMVSAYKKMLGQMGVKNKDIITDYFPGY